MHGLWKIKNMKNIGTSSRPLRFHIVPEPPKLEGSPGSLLPEKQRSPSSRTTPAIAHRSGHAPSLGGPFCHPWLWQQRATCSGITSRCRPLRLRDLRGLLLQHFCGVALKLRQLCAPGFPCSRAIFVLVKKMI